ncbi:MAG TPA: hypothetical protein VF092_21495 [Longimicrobium sp.]
MSRTDLQRLHDDLAGVARAIARLLLRERYDEAELAELEVRRDELRREIATHQEPPKPETIELRLPGEYRELPSHRSQ